jgi:hypothetical protein
LPILFLGIIAIFTSCATERIDTPTPSAKTPIQKIDPTITVELSPKGSIKKENELASGLTITLNRESIARYLVNEQLTRRKLPNDAVGETKEVKGSITFTDKGAVNATKSNITINLVSLKTDEARRDRYVRENTLKTSLYPQASVKIKRIEGLLWPLPSSGKHTFQLVTATTIHGITTTLIWETIASFDGDKVTGQAKTNFLFETFDLKKPTLFFILSVENNIRLELDFIATISRKS